jgi:hypothetical protein
MPSLLSVNGQNCILLSSLPTSDITVSIYLIYVAETCDVFSILAKLRYRFNMLTGHVGNPVLAISTSLPFM